VVGLAPIELLIAFGKICDILRRNELQTRKQKVLKVLSSSQVLDALSLCLASLIFFSVRYISSFKYTFCLGPIVLASLITILKTLFTNREVDHFYLKNEGETFGVIFLSVLRVFLTLQLGNILMKMDGFVEFGWKESFWPFWIFFSILIGLSFSVLLIMATKIFTFIIYRKDLHERRLVTNR